MKKYHLKKLTGEHTHDLASLDAHIPEGWGYIKAGWRTEQQLLDLGLSKEGREVRVVVDREEREVILQEDEKVSEDITVLERTMTEQGIGDYTERYYTVPAVTHETYWLEKNYTIEVEDTTAQELAEATAKAERKVDLAEIKTFLTDIANSDLKPWHKKILKFLVKEAKE